jgi:hypothetical protein
MPSFFPEISQLISHCTPRQSSGPLRYGRKVLRPLKLLGLMTLLLMSWRPVLAQLVSVNGPIVLPATNVASSSAPQNILLKTTSAVTISGFTVPVSQGNKQEYTVGTVSGCAVDGVTSNPVNTVCTVPITFSPAYPGQRLVPLQVMTSAGKIDIGLNGMGTSPLAVLTPGTMSTLAGDVNAPNCNAYNGPALLGPICNPSGGAVDYAGNVYVAAYYSNTVSKIDISGNISVIAGTGAGGLSGVGGPATSATFDRPADVVVDPAGNVYFIGETAQQVFRIDAATQILTGVAGNGNAGYSGDNGPATQASLNYPEGLALDSQGNLYIEDHDNNLIRKVDIAGTITTVAGDPTTVGQNSPAYGGDGGPAIKAPLALAGNGVFASYDSITVDAAGNLFIGDSGHHVVRKVTTDGIIHTVAGNNSLGGGFSGDGGAATSAQLNWPMGVAVDAAGDLYIADFSNALIRKVDAATQTIRTVAGSGTSNTPDSGPATQVSLNGPQKVVLDGLGNLYISDTKNYLIRKVDVSKSVLTFATSTVVGSTDSTDGPLQAIASNIGNSPLTLPAPATGSNASLSAGFGFYIGNSGPCPSEGPSSPAGTLGQGSSCGLSVEFEPVSSGNIAGSIVLADNSLNTASPYVTQTVSLVGTATPAVNTGSLTIAPTTQVFASTAVGGTSATLTSTITNTTSKAIYLSAGSLTDAVDFTQTTTCSGILAATTGTCTVTFTFTPQSTGPLSSTYSVHDLDTPGSPLTVALSGNATAAPAPQPVLTPLMMDFGSLTVGSTSAVQTATLKNTGNAALTISSFGFFGSNASSFSESNTCGSSVAAGSSCVIMIACTPAVSGNLTANLGANFPSPLPQQSIALTCNGATAAAPQATLTPPSADFGSVTSGTGSSAQTFTLSNAGTTSLGITSISLGGANPSSFIVVSDNCATGPVATVKPAHGLTPARSRAVPNDIPALSPGSSCQVLVVFAPNSASSSTATLTIVDQAGTQTSTLTGMGVAVAPPAAPQANLTPLSANFNSVIAGNISTAQTFTLTNAGNAALPITSVGLAGANASAFKIGANSCGSSLAAGSACTVSVTFAPASVGSLTATLSVVDAVGTQISTLSGTGTSVSTADFTLSATPTTQSSYRGTSVSYPVQLGSVSNANPFTSAVTLSVTGLPTGASAAFSPATVVPGTGATSTLTIMIPSLYASSTSQRGQVELAGVSVGTMLLLLLSRRKRLAVRLLLVFCALGLLSAGTIGCGSGNGFAIPSSASTLVIKGTGGTITHTTSVSLTVQ